MAHPFQKHAEHKKGRSRASQILKSAGSKPPALVGGDGGALGALGGLGGMPPAGPPDQPAMPVPGAKRGGRYARGGKVKDKGGQTNIAIVVPQGKGNAGPGAGAPPLGPPPPAPAPPMPGGPPPMPIGPGGPPKPPGMMKRGGRVKHKANGGGIDGDADKGNLDKWASRASTNSYARGGRLPTAGADSGEGRLQKAR